MGIPLPEARQLHFASLGDAGWSELGCSVVPVVRSCATSLRHVIDKEKLSRSPAHSVLASLKAQRTAVDFHTRGFCVSVPTRRLFSNCLLSSMTSADFKAVAERFRVSMQNDPVVVQIGLDGVKVLSPDGQRTMRVYPLSNISRWALRGGSLQLYTKTPVDVEERQVTLQADDSTIRSVLDTLTSACMQ